MTKLLDEAVAVLSALPEDEQDRAAEVLLAFTRERTDYALDDRAPGIDHATAQS